jgi:hypothetical protein
MEVGAELAVLVAQAYLRLTRQTENRPQPPDSPPNSAPETQLAIDWGPK